MSYRYAMRCTILCLLILTGSAQAQQSTIDPMLGGYGVGKSEEIVFIEGQYQTPTNIYIGLYDWNPTTSALIPKDSIQLMTCTTQDWGPKQVDIAVGDFNCDTRDDIVAVAQTTDTTFDLILPRFVPGTLTWDTPYILHSSPNALYFDPDIPLDTNGNISGLRLLAADLDSVPGQEFLLAYLTPDTQVQLVMYKTDSLLNPIAVDSVLDHDRLFTTRPTRCNERSHVFDITAGDFDGDWVDEIMLIGEYRDASDHYVLYSSIYEYSGGSLHRVHFQDSIMWQGRYHVLCNFADRIAVAAADYQGIGSDQALLFMHELGGCEEMYGYLFGLTPDSAMDDMETVRLIDWSNWWEYTINHNAATSDHGLSSVDLNLDGRAEFVIKGGRYMKVGNWQGTSVTWRSGDMTLLGAFDRVTDSRRSVIFADLDLDTAQTSWTPEIIAGFNDTHSAGHLRTWRVDINSSDSITGITQIHDIALPEGGGSVPDTWYSLIYAAGDFDGDGVRLGKPNHVSFTHEAEPLVVLNSPPMHFDILGTDTADVLGFYLPSPGAKNAHVGYTVGTTDEQSVWADNTSNWNFSASAGGTKDLWFGSFSAKVTAAYGGSASRISGSIGSQYTNETVTSYDVDLAFVRSVPYDVWEYPFYVGDSMHGYYVVARPTEASANGWNVLEELPSTSYTPRHERGNLLSYPSSMDDLLNRGDVEEILSNLGSWPVVEGTLAWDKKWGVTKIAEVVESRSRTFSVNLETEAELFGLELSASASHDATSVQTRSSTLSNGFEVNTYLGNLLSTFSDADYRITPVFFWSTAGALVLDYIVDDLDDGYTWWALNYGSAPDPAFLLPWRYASAKGMEPLDPTKIWRTPDLYFRPAYPIRGDSVTIHGKVWNYSLDSLTQDVEVRFYDGDPNCSETSPLLNTAGDSVVVVAGGIGPRRFKDFEFEWEVPLGASPNARVYVVLDPDDQIAEIHDNNNKCWRGVFQDAPAPSTCTPKDVTSPVVDLLDPDGGGLLMSGTTHSIQWASSDDFGTTSCKLEWSADDGVVYGLIDSLPFDSCTYAWVVPDTTTDLARIRVTVYDDAGNSTSDVSNSVFRIASECPIVMTGDADENGSITSADIIKMVNFVFKGGVPPGPCEAAGDVNCSGTCTSADIISLVNFVFKGGTPPCDACTTDPSGWNCP